MLRIGGSDGATKTITVVGVFGASPQSHDSPVEVPIRIPRLSQVSQAAKFTTVLHDTSESTVL
jgi:hypothetical protein